MEKSNIQNGPIFVGANVAWVPRAKRGGGGEKKKDPRAARRKFYFCRPMTAGERLVITFCREPLPPCPRSLLFAPRPETSVGYISPRPLEQFRAPPPGEGGSGEQPKQTLSNYPYPSDSDGSGFSLTFAGG